MRLTRAARSSERLAAGAARRERALARPAEIMAVARDLFARKGFEATRMDEIAAAAGVTKPAVYRYFPGKARLIEAMMQADLVAPSRAALDWVDRHPGPVQDMVRGFAEAVRAMQANGLSRVYLLLAMDEANRHPEIAGFIRREVLEPGLVVLARAFERAMARGELTAGHDPQLTARLFFAPFLQASLGAAGYALPLADEAEADRYRAFHVEAFLRAFGNPEARACP
ncbi:MAG: TetR/AcrR family transcriptional regulator [Pseudomonadota bacterium]